MVKDQCVRELELANRLWSCNCLFRMNEAITNALTMPLKQGFHYGPRVLTSTYIFFSKRATYNTRTPCVGRRRLFGHILQPFFHAWSLVNMSSSGDYQVAACAAGFSLGFGYLTTVRAIHQTRANRAPWRSAYIWMIWGEILANLCLGILTWLWLKDIVKNGYVRL